MYFHFLPPNAFQHDRYFLIDKSKFYLYSYQISFQHIFNIFFFNIYLSDSWEANSFEKTFSMCTENYTKLSPEPCQGIECLKCGQTLCFGGLS